MPSPLAKPVPHRGKPFDAAQAIDLPSAGVHPSGVKALTDAGLTLM
ncbi:MAG: hypothetical protein K1X64_14475 [Myxococcaceae bacterium]|nr:hypothetical protein [Myxococcaceae bacterium]